MAKYGQKRVVLYVEHCLLDIFDWIANEAGTKLL